jgi:hypothetical protein
MNRPAKLVGIDAAMTVNGDTAAEDIRITHNIDGQEGYRLRLVGTNVSGFVTPHCIDLTP